jgi:hypothetical protein
MWKVSPKAPQTQFMCCFQLYKLPLKTNRLTDNFSSNCLDISFHILMKTQVEFFYSHFYTLLLLEKVPNNVILFVFIG